MASYQVARLGQRRVCGAKEEYCRSAKRTDQQGIADKSGYSVDSQDTQCSTKETPDGVTQRHGWPWATERCHAAPGQAGQSLTNG